MVQWLIVRKKFLVMMIVSFIILCGLFVCLWQRAKQKRAIIKQLYYNRNNSS